MRRLFAVVVFRSGWVGGGSGEADFSTSLRSGRNDGVFCWVEGMVEGGGWVEAKGKSKSKSKSKSKDKGKSDSRSSAFGEG